MHRRGKKKARILNAEHNQSKLHDSACFWFSFIGNHQVKYLHPWRSLQSPMPREFILVLVGPVSSAYRSCPDWASSSSFRLFSSAAWSSCESIWKDRKKRNWKYKWRWQLMWMWTFTFKLDQRKFSWETSELWSLNTTASHHITHTAHHSHHSKHSHLTSRISHSTHISCTSHITHISRHTSLTSQLTHITHISSHLTSQRTHITHHSYHTSHHISRVFGDVGVSLFVASAAFGVVGVSLFVPRNLGDVSCVATIKH